MKKWLKTEIQENRMTMFINECDDDTEMTIDLHFAGKRLVGGLSQSDVLDLEVLINEFKKNHMKKLTSEQEYKQYHESGERVTFGQ